MEFFPRKQWNVGRSVVTKRISQIRALNKAKQNNKRVLAAGGNFVHRISLFSKIYLRDIGAQ